MLIAIEQKDTGFTRRWIRHCEQQNIRYKRVNPFSTDAIEQIRTCDALFWHVSHENYKEMLVARELIQALDSAGIPVFPSPAQIWHFDDKLAQAYFFDLHGFPAPKTRALFTLQDATNHLRNPETTYPLIGKLRRGSASSNVFMIRSVTDGERIAKKAFTSGFPLYNLRNRYKDMYTKATGPAQKAFILAKWVYRIAVPPDYSRQSPPEKDYILFQDFIPNRGEDVRVVVVGDRAVALKRNVRKDDFRASGSGLLEFPNENLNKEYIRLAFQITDKLGAISMGIDFIESLDGTIHVIEMSYGFPAENFLDGASGTWSRSLSYTEEPIRLQEWIMDLVLKNVRR